MAAHRRRNITAADHAAGILLGDTGDELHLYAASSDRAGISEELQMHAGASPYLNACRGGQRVIVTDPGRYASKWPAFAVELSSTVSTPWLRCPRGCATNAWAV